jgi:anti-sigma regulatory factor (Ser/Thr protein kinase)
MTETLSDVWLRVPALPESVAVARQALAGLCEALAVEPKVLADVKLAVTEACTNCVVHAYGNSDEAPRDRFFEVEAHPDNAELMVLVRDFGRGISPRAESPGLGLGLPLIAALSKTVEIRGGSDGRSGTEVMMAFALADSTDSYDGEGA